MKNLNKISTKLNKSYINLYNHKFFSYKITIISYPTIKFVIL